MTLGYDLVGTVTALGEDVSGFAEGERVVALTAWGAHQQYVNIPCMTPGCIDGYIPIGGKHDAFAAEWIGLVPAGGLVGLARKVHLAQARGTLSMGRLDAGCARVPDI